MKRLIVFSGPPCSGKSALAERLSAKTGLQHFAMDKVRMRLYPEGPHTRETRQVAYRAMLLAAESLLAAGQGGILDACYGHRIDRREVEAAAVRQDAPVYLVECCVSYATALDRAARRRDVHPGTDLTPDRLRRLVEGFPYFHGGAMVDSHLGIDECMGEISSYLDHGAPLTPGLWPEHSPVP